jgi:hypothetical protein
MILEYGGMLLLSYLAGSIITVRAIVFIFGVSIYLDS